MITYEQFQKNQKIRDGKTARIIVNEISKKVEETGNSLNQSTYKIIKDEKFKHLQERSW